MTNLDKAAQAARAAHHGYDDPRLGWDTLSDYGKATWRKVAAAVLATQRELSEPVDGKLGGQRQGGAATAREARDLVLPKVGSQRDKVLGVFRRDGGRFGLTDVELAEVTGLPPNSVRPRRVELVDAGWVCDTGNRRRHNGRGHVVWGLTPAAKEATA